MEKQQTIQFEDGGSIPTSPHNLFLRVVEKKIAKVCYLRWHYLGSTDFMASVNFGIYYKESLLGAISYGVPSAKEIKGIFRKDEQVGWYEIKRMALSEMCPKNSESRVISVSRRILCGTYDVRGIITYADTSQGHTGIIYRASGFDYRGLTAKKTDLYINGKKVGKKGQYFRGPKESEEWRPRSQKHLFLWINKRYRRI